MILCADDCDRPAAVRGLCRRHYRRRWRHGTLGYAPRRIYTSAELLAEYDHLKAGGCTRERAAARLGLKEASLARALQRAGR